MTRKSFLLTMTATAMIVSAGVVYAQGAANDVLARGFVTPPESARPRKATAAIIRESRQAQ